MRFRNAVVPVDHAWSTAFCRWQGAFADMHSLDLAEQLVTSAFATRGFDAAALGGMTLGITVPQAGSFYGTPTLATRIGAPHLGGPMIAQACATSAAVIAHASALVGAEPDTAPHLAVATDRTSNGPLLVTPGPGGVMTTEDRIRDAFAADPLTGRSMVETAEDVAREAGFSREQLDDVTLRRYAQYDTALADDRAFQRRYMVPIEVSARRDSAVIDRDLGVHPASADGVRGARPSLPQGVVTGASQTHPADGAAAMLVMTIERAREMQPPAVAQILSTGFARAESGGMPKAPVPAARRALADAGIDIRDVALITTHNPFAVNDLWLARELGVSQDQINTRGSSLVYGHPQAPTGMRAVIELMHALVDRGGGIGLFSGCAAGDSAGAIVIRVDEPAAQAGA